MALPLSEKLSRVLKLLVGVRNPRVFSILTTRGFTQEDLDEGWDLFTPAAGAKLRYTGRRGDPLAPDVAGRLLGDLDHWENSWFPVVSATLERHHPEIHEVVFKNLSQTSGVEVVVSVGTLLDRIEKMKETEEGPKADELLCSRGLTPEVRAQAATIVERLKRSEEAALPEIDLDSKEEQERALAGAWGWYREWSQIARTLITRGDVLIRLGLRKPIRRGAPDDDDSGEEGSGGSGEE